METTELQKFKNELIDQGINVLQVFSGHIIDSDQHVYYVRLYDENPEGEDLTAEIYTKNFPLPNLSNGTIFYWFIGENDKQEDFSLIRLTEAKWTEDQIRKVEIESKILFEKLNKLDKTML